MRTIFSAFRSKRAGFLCERLGFFFFLMIFFIILC